MIVECDVHFPSNAFSPRDACRAGDPWRLCQDVAVVGSAAAGWPPKRLREVGAAFVMRGMTVVHHRESALGEALRAQTWVGDFRRGMFTTRYVRVDGDRGPVLRAAQD